MKIQEKKKEKILEQIEKFFDNILTKSPKEIKKIKKKAMSKNIHLSNNRRKFCKYCLTPYTGKENVRIRNKHKIIVCNKCGKKNKINLTIKDK